MTMKMKCDSRAEISGDLPAFFCGRIPGHKGECSGKMKATTTHDHKRVEIELLARWPSPKMLRRKFGVSGFVKDGKGGL